MIIITLLSFHFRDFKLSVKKTKKRDKNKMLCGSSTSAAQLAASSSLHDAFYFYLIVAYFSQMLIDINNWKTYYFMVTTATNPIRFKDAISPTPQHSLVQHLSICPPPLLSGRGEEEGEGGWVQDTGRQHCRVAQQNHLRKKVEEDAFTATMDAYWIDLSLFLGTYKYLVWIAKADMNFYLPPSLSLHIKQVLLSWISLKFAFSRFFDDICGCCWVAIQFGLKWHSAESCCVTKKTSVGKKLRHEEVEENRGRRKGRWGEGRFRFG